MEWKTVIATIGLVSLCFMAIPVKIEPSETTDNDLKLFKTYVDNYKKSYALSPDEYAARFKIFQKSLRRIDDLNAKRTSELSARYGITEYSDLTEEEFASLHLRPDISYRGLRHLHHSHHHRHNSHHHHESKDYPDSRNRIRRSLTKLPPRFDWREKGFVTPIRNQGNCGACWAFSTVEVAETMLAIKNGILLPLSVQQMIDCAGNSNFGCNGGDICSLLMWLTSTGVEIKPELSYPTTLKTGMCRLNPLTSPSASRTGARVTNFTCDNFVDAEDELMNVIVDQGPVAAAVNALSWQNYLGGIIQYHCDGSFNSLNHAVQIVGYDVSGSVPYYIVRNSWGKNFGDKGYLYIAMNQNLCGIANQVSSMNVT